MTSEITNLDNIDVWKSKSDFNYDKWHEDVNIYLTTVDWDAHQNVARFQGYSERREFFHRRGTLVDKTNYASSVNQTLGSERIRLQIPYYQMIDYNYFFLEKTAGTPPVIGNVGSRTDGSARDRCYFISDIRQISPSVTELVLSLDIWATYSPGLLIQQAHYLRGHKDSQAISVAEFFEGDRLSASLNLEPEPLKVNRSQNHATPIPLNNTDSGKTVLCFVTSANWLTSSGNTYQALAENYWTFDLSSSEEDHFGRINRDPTAGDTGAINGMNCYFIDLNNARLFFNNLKSFQTRTGSNVFSTIQLVFTANINWLNTSISGDFTENDISIRVTKVVAAEDNILTQINPQQLVDRSKYQSNYYKAYTGQFLPIDLYRGDEFVGTFGLENMADVLNVHINSSLVYPFISFRAFFTGLSAGSSDGTSFGYVRANGDGHQETIFSSDVEKTLYDLNIPFYVVAEDGSTRFDIDHKPGYTATSYDADQEKTRSTDSLTADYQNTTRDIQGAADNANTRLTTSNINNNQLINDANNNANDNSFVAASNANDSNKTNYANANNLAKNAHEQNLNDIQTNYGNASRSIETSNTNSVNQTSAQHQINQNQITENHRATLAANAHEHKITEPSTPLSPDYEEAQSTWDIERYHSQLDMNRFKQDSDDGFEWVNTFTEATTGIDIAARAIGALATTGISGAVGAAGAAAGVSAAVQGGTIADISTAIGKQATVQTNMAFSLGDAGADAISSSGGLIGAKFAADHRHTSEQTRATRQRTVWLNYASAANRLASEFTLSEEEHVNENNLANEKLQNDAAVASQKLSYDTATTNAKNSSDRQTERENTTYPIENTARTDSFNTDTANLKRSYDNELAVTKRNYDTAIANEKRNFEAEGKIIDNDRIRESTNLDNSNTVALKNIQSVRDQVSKDLSYDQVQRYNTPDQIYATPGGDYLAQDNRGFYYKFVARVPSKEDQTKINQLFDRYGYTWNKDLDEPLQASGLVDADRQFNYWQLGDVIFGANPMRAAMTPQLRYQDQLRSDLSSGVRVWNPWKLENMEEPN